MALYGLHYSWLSKLIPLSELDPSSGANEIAASADAVDLMQKAIKLLFSNNLDLAKTAPQAQQLLSSNKGVLPDWLMNYWNQFLELMIKTGLPWEDLVNYAHAGSRHYIVGQSSVGGFFAPHFLYNYMQILDGTN